MSIGIKKIIATIAIATTITGCGSGQMAQTRLIKQVTDGVEAQSDEVRLRNVKVIKTANGQGVLIGTLVNWSDQVDAITSITINNQPAIFIMLMPIFQLWINHLAIESQLPLPLPRQHHLPLIP
ncbi:MAG: hypothetical protein RLY62_1059 [Actinomycetota bacterium]